MLGGNFPVEGNDNAPGAYLYSGLTAVGSGYFDALDVALVSGRLFTDRDAPDVPRVAIVNEAFVRKFNLGENAVGRRIGDGRPQSSIEIVGVVAARSTAPSRTTCRRSSICRAASGSTTTCTSTGC